MPLLAFCQKSNGVEKLYYRLNSTSGLPSNHTYSGTVDKYGYLWICTPKGVARYNGYQVTTFDIGDGLFTNDIWGVYSDRWGRTWLHNIGSELGYIRNDNYKLTSTPNQDVTFYPWHITEYSDGIMFASPNVLYDSSQLRITPLLFIEKNDTIRRLKFDAEDIKINNKNYFVLLRGDSSKLYRYESNGPEALSKCFCLPIWRRSDIHFTIFFNDFLLYYRDGGNVLYQQNVLNCFSDSMVLFKRNKTPDTINSDLRYKDNYYVIATENIYKFDTAMHLLQRFPVSGMTNDPSLSSKNISYRFEDSAWGGATFTTNKGLFIEPHVINKFTSVAVPSLDQYSYIGNITDTMSCWWSEESHTLMTISRSAWIKKRKLSGKQRLEKLVAYKGGRHFLIAHDQLGVVGDNFSDVEPVNERYSLYTNDVSAKKVQKHLSIIKDIVATGNGFYIAFDYQVEHVSVTDTTFIFQSLFGGKYTGLENDKIHNGLWAYNDNEVIFFHKSIKNKVRITHKMLRKFGIRHIESIQVDTLFGNVFINDGKQILYINIATRKTGVLFKSYDTKGGLLFVQNDKIVCAGSFGALFMTIKGPAAFSSPVFYQNAKGALYNTFYDACLVGHMLMLKTDKGIFTTPFPEAKEYLEPEKLIPYRIILNYNDSNYIPNTETLLPVDQKQHVLKVDVINPLGVGAVKVYYAIWDRNSHYSGAGNEIILSMLEPGHSYTMRLIAKDGQTTSRPVFIRLFVNPFWWQTKGWKAIFWFAAISVLVIFAYLVSRVTAKAIKKKSLKQKRLLELELRSVYAQINPHFIFNTLNSALFFIKKRRIEEAYEHVEKFAGLLRGYLESARTRYVTIERDVANLSRYIELQQTRFTDLFSFEIKLQEGLPANRILIPSMLVQPFVENAIQHGLAPKERNGILKIEIMQVPNSMAIKVIIDDNGIGRAASQQINIRNSIRKKSQGNELLRQLIQVYNKYEKMDIRINYHDKTGDEAGTTVIICINHPKYENV